MNYSYLTHQAFIALSFLGFGVGCFVSAKASEEFTRYGLKDKQKIIGSLQILAAFGLLAAFLLKVKVLTLIVSFCLSLMMAVATVVRIRIKDSYLLMVPAFSYFLICFIFFLRSFPI